MIEIEMEGDKVVVARLGLRARRSVKEIDEITYDNTQQLVEQIKRNASGRPGPNVVTGDYRDSWFVKVSRSLGSLFMTKEYAAATAHPAWRRLEYGFVGVDSLGRHYDQRPFPHIRPAVDAQRRQYQADVSKWARELKL